MAMIMWFRRNTVLAVLEIQRLPPMGFSRFYFWLNFRNAYNILLWIEEGRILWVIVYYSIARWIAALCAVTRELVPYLKRGLNQDG